ncbi:MAG TPA: serine--tRNA ligase, partial [Pirellulales bacterium]
MLDRKFIVDHADQVKENCTLRGARADVDRFVLLDAKRREKQAHVEELNRNANEVAKSIGKGKDAAEREARKTEGRELRDRTAAAQSELDTIAAEM